MAGTRADGAGCAAAGKARKKVAVRKAERPAERLVMSSPLVREEESTCPASGSGQGRLARIPGAAQESQEAARHHHVEAAPDEGNERFGREVDGECLGGGGLEIAAGGQAENLDLACALVRRHLADLQAALAGERRFR